MTMEGIPEKVTEAQRKSDSEALARMGAKGGIHAGLMNTDRKSKREKDLEVFMAQQEQIHYHISDEGDVLPPDPKIVDKFEH